MRKENRKMLSPLSSFLTIILLWRCNFWMDGLAYDTEALTTLIPI